MGTRMQNLWSTQLEYVENAAVTFDGWCLWQSSAIATAVNLMPSLQQGRLCQNMLSFPEIVEHMNRLCVNVNEKGNVKETS